MHVSLVCVPKGAQGSVVGGDLSLLTTECGKMERGRSLDLAMIPEAWPDSRRSMRIMAQGCVR